MSYILDLINANIYLAPLIAFGALIASGFNVPISEDLLNVACGLLAVRHPDMALELYLGIFLGAYISDCICYWLGRTVGNRLLFGGGRMQARKARILKKVRRHFDQHAALALIVGRFIPFGVRNAMYLTAGVGKYSFWRFAVLDFIGCLLSTSVLFQLTYRFGEPIAESFASRPTR